MNQSDKNNSKLAITVGSIFYLTWEEREMILQGKIPIFAKPSESIEYFKNNTENTEKKENDDPMWELD